MLAFFDRDREGVQSQLFINGINFSYIITEVYVQILASADILVSFTYICLSTLLVEVINGEWREARQMRRIPIAFSYFKVLVII